MVPVHDYEKRYAEAFAITRIRTFKHEPFFIVGGGGGGGLFVVLYGISELRRTEYKRMRLNSIGMIFRIALVKLHSMVYVFPIPDSCCTCKGQITSF